jgi:2-(1,2-epoxy-1,2-dihydrophenyl)acetyl-CoA isomerase
MARAKAMLMLGEGATGLEAVDLGLAYRCVADAETLLPEALEVARKLAAGPTRSLGLSKRLLNTSFESDLSDSLEREGYFQELATASPDLVEGMAAFRDKRDANFDGT